MTNFEGDIMEYDRRTDYAIEISDDNDMFQNCFVSMQNLCDHIYSTISSTYSYDPGSMYKH